MLVRKARGRGKGHANDEPVVMPLAKNATCPGIHSHSAENNWSGRLQTRAFSSSEFDPLWSEGATNSETTVKARKLCLQSADS